MATFNIGDFVEVCHQPDRKWSEWNKDSHSHFCGKIGYIETFIEDEKYPSDRREDLAKVSVYFFDNTFQYGPGLYYSYFKQRHLIKTTEYEAQRREFAHQAAEETNHFEEFTRNKRDEIFRSIFGVEDRRKKKFIEEEWELKTPVFVYDDGDPII